MFFLDTGFVAGIVLGALFSPFWMKVGSFVKKFVLSFIKKKEDELNLKDKP